MILEFLPLYHPAGCCSDDIRPQIWKLYQFTVSNNENACDLTGKTLLIPLRQMLSCVTQENIYSWLTAMSPTRDHPESVSILPLAFMYFLPQFWFHENWNFECKFIIFQPV
jgi:hypothetical protein